ncbi:MAG: hypothetical protein PUB21_11870 [Bacteroidales bacterium]|nr:hypothetical protein [Bacteroidales bacterium]
MKTISNADHDLLIRVAKYFVKQNENNYSDHKMMNLARMANKYLNKHKSYKHSKTE